MVNNGFGIAHHGLGILGLLFLLLVIAAVVLGVILLVRLWQQSKYPAHPPSPATPWIDPAVSELRMRYARGEISWDEFSQRMAGLGYPAQPAHVAPHAGASQPGPGGQPGPGAGAQPTAP